MLWLVRVQFPCWSSVCPGEALGPGLSLAGCSEPGGLLSPKTLQGTAHGSPGSLMAPNQQACQWTRTGALKAWCE